MFIATPQFLHTEISIAALSNGLNVFCEKPLATTVEDANRIVEAVKKSGKIFQIGQQWRYTPMYDTIRALVRQGAVGPVQYVIGSIFRGRHPVRAPEFHDTVGSVLGAKEATLSPERQNSPEYRQLVAFEEAVRTGRQPLNAVEVGRDAAKISLLAQKSIDVRRPVS